MMVNTMVGRISVKSNFGERWALVEHTGINIVNRGSGGNPGRSDVSAATLDGFKAELVVAGKNQASGFDVRSDGVLGEEIGAEKRLSNIGDGKSPRENSSADLNVYSALPP